MLDCAIWHVSAFGSDVAKLPLKPTAAAEILGNDCVYICIAFRHLEKLNLETEKTISIKF